MRAPKSRHISSFIVVVAVIAGLTRCRTLFKEPNVRPGVNAEYRHPDVETWVQRFETESREIYRSRDRIVETVGIQPGQAVADIGAGTGLFTLLFARQVGTAGRVYAVDIVPEFLERIRTLARREKLSQIVPVLCREDSVELPPASVDLAFLCDTYHHFEYPKSTLASINRALKPDGRLIVVDFKRIEGVTRDWVLKHVRAGQEAVLAELRAGGFVLVDSPSIPGLQENYVLRLRKAPLPR